VSACPLSQQVDANRQTAHQLTFFGGLNLGRKVLQQALDVGGFAVDLNAEVFAKATTGCSQTPDLLDAQTQAAPGKTIGLGLGHDDDQFVVAQQIAMGVDQVFIGGGLDDGTLVVELEDGELAHAGR